MMEADSPRQRAIKVQGSDVWYSGNYLDRRVDLRQKTYGRIGKAFELAFKHRQLDSGPVVYWACDALQQIIISP
ncbi:hypothetical protein E4P00_21285 [Pseudomonas sp. B329]|nr:hypothetical protein [Pseudomonas sp. B329]